jgi:SAM-dependent methyltransferase
MWIATCGTVIIEPTVTPNALSSPESESLFGRPGEEVARALPEREHVVCPLCGVPPRTFAIDFQGFHLARCSACGLEFQSPRPVFDQLARSVYGRSYHPADDSAIDSGAEWHYARQLDRLARFLPTDRRRLLDVGCGTGTFMRYASRRRWTVEGTDVVVADGARAADVRVWEGQLPSIDFEDHRFDAVRFNQVLEHTQDPLAELRRASDLVGVGGVLCVGVPNLAGLSVRLKSWQSRLHLKSRRWKHYAALHHLWFFTPRTLARLVAAAGFDVLRWETPVLARRGRPPWATALMRTALQGARLGGILDLYAHRRA